MPVVLEQGVVRLDGHGLVEEAMTLLEILQATPEARIDLGGCESLHAALLQVLAAARPTFVSLPTNPLLADVVGRCAGGTA